VTSALTDQSPARRRRRIRTATSLLAVALCGCGGGGGSDREQRPGNSDPAATGILFRGTAADTRTRPETDARRGGQITALSAGDVDTLDPGATYYAYTYSILNALQRGLYTYVPGDTAAPRPDLAASAPRITDHGRTVTVRLRGGVRFSRPVSREVTARDVKYAIERAFTSNVAGPYVYVYFGDLVGAPSRPGPYREVPGIETPDEHTIVFRLERATGAALAGALAMPVTIPVPAEYARRFDAERPSEYGTHQVFTGPYKIEADDAGELTGYEPGRRIVIVRNPDYVKAGDFRPAFADGYDIRAGYDDSGTASRRILMGHRLIGGDTPPSSAALKRALETARAQVSAVASGGWRAITFDTSRPPFDDLDVRKAVIAGFDRLALRTQHGGPALGVIAQHYIPPGIPGFEQSGGTRGFEEFDWMRNPGGDRDLSARYFRAAGFASGRYEGDETVLLVGAAADPERNVAQLAEQQLQQLGFKTKLRLYSLDTVGTRFCGVPDSEVHVCPNMGWARDFSDAQTMLDPTFNGANIRDAGNANMTELNDPEVNRAIERARLVNEPRERTRAWADVNRRVVALAPAVPYMWDYVTAISSADVQGVQNDFTGGWDLSFTSVR
jgi:peptide/nickel transport system substrate-binding protein